MRAPFGPNIFAASLLAVLITVGVNAQAQTPKTLLGYEPSVVSSEEEALRLYKLMPTEIFRSKSQCHQRAHYWAYTTFFKQMSLKTMKVYLFFTDRYRREFSYDWRYHVAPLIPVRLADGTIEDQVFDPTFTSMPSWASEENANRYDSKPVSVAEWTKYFIFPHAECPLVENYSDFWNYQDRYYCYIMKTPMFNYIPDNFETEETVRTDWREGDLLEMQNGLKSTN